MADLVGGSVAKVVLGQAATGDRSGADDNTVVVESRGTGGDGLGEVGISEVGGTGEEVDVQIGVSALAERSLHGELGAVRSPLAVDGPVDTGLCERDVVRRVSLVEDIQLSVQGGLGKVTTADRVRSGNDVPVDIDRDGRKASSITLDASVIFLELKALGNFDLLLGGGRGAAGTLGESSGGGRKGGDEDSLELHDEDETGHLIGVGLAGVG